MIAENVETKNEDKEGEGMGKVHEAQQSKIMLEEQDVGTEVKRKQQG